MEQKGEMDGATAGTSIQALCEEAVCPICLGYFRDPVITDCGHNFCQSCLAPRWEKSGQEASCPQCQKKIQERNVRPNRELASFVEINKKPSLPGPEVGKEKERECEKQQEPTNMFCEDDEVFICVGCERSQEYQDHEIELTEIKEIMLATYRECYQCLEEEEATQLGQMKEWEEKIVSKREERLAELSTRLENLIKKTEEQYQQLPKELLQDLCSGPLGNLKKEGNDILACEAAIEKETEDQLKQKRVQMERTLAKLRQKGKFVEDEEDGFLAAVKATEEESEGEMEEQLAGLPRKRSPIEIFCAGIQERHQRLTVPN